MRSSPMAANFPDPTFLCPHCHKPVPLTETLAAPLIDAARREALAEADRRTKDLARREEELRKAKASVEEQVAQKLLEEKERVTKAAREIALADVEAQMKDLRDQLAGKASKLEEAQRQELELRNKARTLEEQQKTWELEKARQLDVERKSILEKAQVDLEERHRLEKAEKEELIAGMRRQIEDLRRKAEQGSQQAQGEVLELDLEANLRLAFPADVVEPVKKGVRGGDCVQRVTGPGGIAAGAILWESKRTRAWSEGWLDKLRDDQREAKAEVAILVTTTLPKEIARFGLREGVWVTDVVSSIALASALRAGLIQVAAARAAGTGRETKVELLYEYLCGREFRARIEGIVEAFRTMESDLAAERAATERQWAKREKQLQRVLRNTSGMYGDLQGIAGSSLPELPSLGGPADEAIEGRAITDGSAA